MVTLAWMVEKIILLCILGVLWYMLLVGLPENKRLYEECDFITLCESGALKYNQKCENHLEQKKSIQIVNITY